MVDAMGLPYADSYLSGAKIKGGNLVPHTVTAWERLKRQSGAMRVIAEYPLRLEKPLPFGHPDREDTKRRAMLG